MSILHDCETRRANKETRTTGHKVCYYHTDEDAAGTGAVVTRVATRAVITSAKRILRDDDSARNDPFRRMSSFGFRYSPLHLTVSALDMYRIDLFAYYHTGYANIPSRRYAYV